MIKRWFWVLWLLAVVLGTVGVVYGVHVLMGALKQKAERVQLLVSNLGLATTGLCSLILWWWFSAVRTKVILGERQLKDLALPLGMILVAFLSLYSCLPWKEIIAETLTDLVKLWLHFFG